MTDIRNWIHNNPTGVNVILLSLVFFGFVSIKPVGNFIQNLNSSTQSTVVYYS